MTEEELLIVLSGSNGVFLEAEKGEMEIEPQMRIIVKKDGSDILFSSCTHGGYHIDLSKK